MKRLLLLMCCTIGLLHSAAQVQHAEYFFDADPGFGLGIPLGFDAPEAATTFTFNAGISSLSNGVHRLYIRVYDAASGSWSQSMPKFFYKEAADGSPGLAHIIRAEYFIDNDPGVGAGVHVPVTGGQDVTFNFTAAIDALDAGLHRLVLRTQDASGLWSMRTAQVFYKEKLVPDMQADIMAAEYFFDTDPGIGAGTPIPVIPGTDVIFPLSPSVAALPNGVHRLFIRTKDANGNWSLSASQLLYKEPVHSESPADIVKMEYFFDADPGMGGGTDIPFGAGQDVTVAFNPAIATLSTDNFHRLFIRSQDAGGRWSHSASQLCYIPYLPPSVQSDITRLEYFFDEDPGFGAATDVPLTPGMDITVNFTSDISELSNGIHRIVLRSRDANGNWSLAGAQMFYREAVQSHTAASMVRAEYFIDTDPGIGVATSVPVVPGQDITFAFSNSLAGLAPGMHRLYVRTMDAGGEWSLSAPMMFYYEAVQSHWSANIVRAEYFIDNDPGFGAAASIPIMPGQEIAANFNSVIENLSTGMHRLVVRSQDAAGNWSISTSSMFYKDTLFAHTPGNLVKLEWFWDTDPGFGNGHPVVLPAGQTEVQHFTFDVAVDASFSNEQHYLFLRAQDDWGLTAMKVVDFTGIPLPVTLLDFRARSEEGRVRLDWQAAQEKNMERYIVERSADGRLFEAIGSRKAIGNEGRNADYIFYDEHPVAGLNYYRLQQVEQSGEIKYTPVVTVLFSGNAGDVKLFPNPATGHFAVAAGSNVSGVLLTDMTGKVIRRYDAARAYSLQGVAAGTYLVQVLLTDNSTAIKTILVQ